MATGCPKSDAVRGSGRLAVAVGKLAEVSGREVSGREGQAGSINHPSVTHILCLLNCISDILICSSDILIWPSAVLIWNSAVLNLSSYVLKWSSV